MIPRRKRIEAEYRAYMKDIPVNWLKYHADIFASSLAQNNFIKEASRVVSALDQASDELIFVTDGLAITGKAIVKKSFGLKNFSISGNELEEKKGILTGLLDPDALREDSRFLTVCDAMSCSPDEIWYFGPLMVDMDMLFFADAVVTIEGQELKAVKGESELKKAKILI